MRKLVRLHGVSILVLRLAPPDVSSRVSNENLVLGSARFIVEKQQLEQRVRLDGPSLSDPTIRDLLQESDIFARSFNGGGFGLISPLDFLQVLAIVTEIISHLLLIRSLTHNAAHIGILVISVISVLFPLVLPWFTCPPTYPDLFYTPQESYAARRQEQMRNLAYSDLHRPEVSLFGLHDWILTSWSSAWKVVFASEQSRSSPSLSVLYGNGLTDLILSLQNVGFLNSISDWCLTPQPLRFPLCFCCKRHRQQP